MIRLITYLAILLTLQINCNGQSFFNLTDSVFEVGQIKRIQIIYELSGGCHPTIESLHVLDSVVIFLQLNENLKIEIVAHTDYRGDSTMNEHLSELRAKRVKDYLTEKGIEITRLEQKGYGEYCPIVVCKELNKKYPFLPIGQKLTEDYIKKIDSVEKQEIAHMLNCRTELKIIKKTNMP